MPLGSSPMAVRRFAISLRLRPASMRIRVVEVLINVVLPRLPLPSTETVTAIGDYYAEQSGHMRAGGFKGITVSGIAPRGGLAVPTKKYREATTLGTDGVVVQTRTIHLNNHPVCAVSML